MGKVCVACGAGVDEPMSPAGESENCPECGGEGTVREEGEEMGGDMEEMEGESEEE